MRRKEFIGTFGAAASVLGMPLQAREGGPRHIVSLSFDDGFRKSFIRTAEIYEQFGLSACFNVTAAGNRPESPVVDDYISIEQLGDFKLWNELQERGHEIMPHGHHHEHLNRMPFAQATQLIEECIAIFEAELKGWSAKKAVFNFPYNDATPELEAWIPNHIRAYRCHGEIINPLPRKEMVKIGTGGWGPDNAEADIDQAIEDLLSRDSGWLVYNVHGLDDEGWGPIREKYLIDLLDRLTKIESVSVLPTAKALLSA